MCGSIPNCFVSKVCLTSFGVSCDPHLIHINDSVVSIIGDCGDEQNTYLVQQLVSSSCKAYTGTYWQNEEELMSPVWEDLKMEQAYHRHATQKQCMSGN